VHSNSYTVVYASVLTVVVGASLAIAVSGLKPQQERNALTANRRAILQTVAEVNPQSLEADYQAWITERVFNREGQEVSDVAAFSLILKDEARKPSAQQRLPLFVFSRDGVTRYIVPMQGAGLWGPIGAYLAIEADLTTIFGVAFSHEKETPGLGAEIDRDFFEDRYKGKKIYAESAKLEPVVVLRGSGNDTGDMPHAVDGLTGATITLNGVSQMFRDELSRYERIFAALQQTK